MSDARITVSIDELAEAAYIAFNDNDVCRTDEFDDTTNVDLDSNGMVTGIELLDLTASVPFDDLATKYHIDSRVIDLLKQIAAGHGRTRYAAGRVAAPHVLGAITPQPLLSSTGPQPGRVMATF